jgi:hypothetical protein
MSNPQLFHWMKNSLLLPRPSLLAGALIFSAAALTALAQDISDPLETSGWFVRMDAAARFGLKATAKTFPVAPARQGVYDNGSVLPDIGGRASGLTWNWSYQSANQVTYDANSQPFAIVYQRLADVPIVSGDVDLTSPMLEGEVIGGYRLDDFSIGKHKARIGFELGYGYFSSSHSMNFQASGQAFRTVDAYRLFGVIPPVAPYAGTFNGPGPILDLNPSSHSVNGFLTTTTFESSLKTSFHQFRFGPSFGIDLSKRFGVQVGAGYQSLFAEATVDYRETSAYTPNPSSVHIKQSKWRPGIYAEILLNVRLTTHLQAFVGGDFLYNNDLTFGDSRHEFTLDLGSTYAAKGGLTYSF